MVRDSPSQLRTSEKERDTAGSQPRRNKRTMPPRHGEVMCMRQLINRGATHAHALTSRQAVRRTDAKIIRTALTRGTLTSQIRSATFELSFRRRGDDSPVVRVSNRWERETYTAHIPAQRLAVVANAAPALTFLPTRTPIPTPSTIPGVAVPIATFLGAEHHLPPAVALMFLGPMRPAFEAGTLARPCWSDAVGCGVLEV
jgi:hypothetical protein